VKGWDVSLLFAVLCWGALACGPNNPAAADPGALKVTAVRLEKAPPRAKTECPGTVIPWKSQPIGFEISGRVAWVVAEGSRARGDLRDADGRRVQEGTLLARLDRSRYELHLKAAQAELARAKARQASLKVRVEQILPEQLRGAQADLARVEKLYRRIESLAKEGVTTPAKLEAAEAAFKAARSRVDQIQAGFVSSRAEIGAAEGGVLVASEAVRQAERDVRDSELHAPFDACVTEVHVWPGAYAEPGRPIVTLSVMDPIKVAISLPVAIAGRVAPGDAVLVALDGREPITGRVYSVREAVTGDGRTLQAQIVVPNRRVLANVPAEDGLPKLPRASKLSFARRVGEGDGEVLAVNVDALRKDESGAFLWVLREGAPGDERTSPVRNVGKVRVVPGGQTFQVLRDTYRRLRKWSDLDERRAIVVDAPSGLREGASILLATEQWALRPGARAIVTLNVASSGPDYAVPARAVRSTAGGHVVFVVSGDRAVPVRVQVRGNSGERRPIDGEGLREGMLVITSHVDVLTEGRRIKVSSARGKEAPVRNPPAAQSAGE